MLYGSRVKVGVTYFRSGIVVREQLCLGESKDRNHHQQSHEAGELQCSPSTSHRRRQLQVPLSDVKYTREKNMSLTASISQELT